MIRCGSWGFSKATGICWRSAVVRWPTFRQSGFPGVDVDDSGALTKVKIVVNSKISMISALPRTAIPLRPQLPHPTQASAAESPSTNSECLPPKYPRLVGLPSPQFSFIRSRFLARLLSLKVCAQTFLIMRKGQAALTSAGLPTSAIRFLISTATFAFMGICDECR